MQGKTILITGGTGLIGSRLTEILTEKGNVVHVLSRSKHKDSDHIKYFKWNPNKSEIDDNAVLVDYIVNLAGNGIADKRWTKERKKLILESRIQSLQVLEKSLKNSGHNPEAMVSSSAIGYYGNRGNEILTEDSLPQEGFLGDTCQQWENQANKVFEHTRRGTIVRTGVVLSTKGGALQKILMTSPLRMLQYFGSGMQYFSWIHIDDLCNVIIQALKDGRYEGVINAVAPKPITNKEFIKSVSEGLGGGYLIIPIPSLALKLALGDMSSVVLDSTRVIPHRLNNLDYLYKHPDLEAAIRHLSETRI